MTIEIIACMSKNFVIGEGGTIPWHISEDLKRFKQLTLGHTVIMGRKTWESIGEEPLKGRKNVILTTNYRFHPIGVHRILHSTKELIDFAKSSTDGKVFLIGGHSVFSIGLKIASVAHLTIVEEMFRGDTFFPWRPLLLSNEWKPTRIETKLKNEDRPLGYSFITYQKKEKVARNVR